MQQNQVYEGFTMFASTQFIPNRNYKLLKQLGQGGEGSVYIAQALNNNGKQVAIKFTLKNRVSEEEINFLQNIMRYQRSFDEITYPCNIIPVFDYFEYNQYFVTVMEKGEMDLYTYISQNQASLSLQEKLNICLDVTIPINFLHSNGLFHRDIKPENYLKFGTKFKLIDFGLVNKSLSSRIKTIGIGTPLFSAPEVINNQANYTEKVDCWSLACLFYEIFSGQSLIKTNYNETLQEQILNHQNNSQKIFNRINFLNCVPELKELMKKMLEFDANKRISSQEVIESLKQIKINFQFQPLNQQNLLKYNIDQSFKVQIQEDIKKMSQDVELKFNVFVEQFNAKKLEEKIKEIAENQLKSDKNVKELDQHFNNQFSDFAACLFNIENISKDQISSKIIEDLNTQILQQKISMEQQLKYFQQQLSMVELKIDEEVKSIKNFLNIEISQIQDNQKRQADQDQIWMQQFKIIEDLNTQIQQQKISMEQQLKYFQQQLSKVELKINEEVKNIKNFRNIEISQIQDDQKKQAEQVYIWKQQFTQGSQTLSSQHNYLYQQQVYFCKKLEEFDQSKNQKFEELKKILEDQREIMNQLDIEIKQQNQQQFQEKTTQMFQDQQCKLEIVENQIIELKEKIKTSPQQIFMEMGQLQANHLKQSHEDKQQFDQQKKFEQIDKEIQKMKCQFEQLSQQVINLNNRIDQNDQQYYQGTLLQKDIMIKQSSSFKQQVMKLKEKMVFLQSNYIIQQKALYTYRVCLQSLNTQACIIINIFKQYFREKNINKKMITQMSCKNLFKFSNQIN